MSHIQDHFMMVRDAPTGVYFASGALRFGDRNYQSSTGVYSWKSTGYTNSLDFSSDIHRGESAKTRNEVLKFGACQNKCYAQFPSLHHRDFYRPAQTRGKSHVENILGSKHPKDVSHRQSMTSRPADKTYSTGLKRITPLACSSGQRCWIHISNS